MGTLHRHGAILAALAVSLLAVCPAGAAIGDCGQPLTFGNKPTAADALVVLRAAVGAIPCTTCVCDVNADGDVTSGDALRVLRFAVGSASDLDCLVCKAQTVIGPAGGLLSSLDNSVTLVFPPGAIDDDTTVSIEGAGASELPSALRANGGARVWRLEPDSLQLDQPVSVRIPATQVPGVGVIGTQIELMISIDGEDVEALPNLTTRIEGSGPAASLSTSASLSHFSFLAVVPLEVTARIIGVPTETEIDQQHQISAAVVQTDEEEVVQVVSATYLDTDFGSWRPPDNVAIDDPLEETIGGTFADTYEYVCDSQVVVGFSPQIVTVMDIEGLLTGIDHTTSIETTIVCEP